MSEPTRFSRAQHAQTGGPADWSRYSPSPCDPATSPSRAKQPRCGLLVVRTAVLDKDPSAGVHPNDAESSNLDRHADTPLWGRFSKVLPRLSASPSAHHGIAIWDQVRRAGVVRHDVASLSAPSRADGSAAARNAVGAKTCQNCRLSGVACRRVGGLSNIWRSIRAKHA